MSDFRHGNRDGAELSPRISVIVPAHNAARYLYGALHSILNQSIADIEVIVANDASSDSTRSIAEAICDDRVRVLDLPRGGLASTRNRGAAVAKGRFLAFADADDLNASRRLEKQLEILDSDLSIGAVGCDQVIFSDDGSVIQRGIFPVSPGACEVAAYSYNPMSSAIVIRRELFEAVGGYCEGMELAEDYELNTRLIRARARLSNVPLPLYFYRYHAASLTNARSVEMIDTLNSVRECYWAERTPSFSFESFSWPNAGSLRAEAAPYLHLARRLWKMRSWSSAASWGASVALTNPAGAVLAIAQTGKRARRLRQQDLVAFGEVAEFAAPHL